MEKFKNIAFISYSHKDKKIAKKLQRKLSGYKLPTKLRQERPELPEKIGEFFRDETHLVPGPLDDRLKNALDDSKYLIVICSLNSAESYWVNEEIKYFKNELNREKNIIPVIINGNPNSKENKNELFPLELRNIEYDILGIEVDGVNNISIVCIKIIAAILDLDVVELLNLDIDYSIKKKKIIRLLCFVTITVFIAMIGALYVLKEKYDNIKVDEVILVSEKALRNGDIYTAQLFILNYLQKTSFDSNNNKHKKLRKIIYQIEEFDQMAVQSCIYRNFQDIKNIHLNPSNDTLIISEGSWNTNKTKICLENGSCVSNYIDISLQNLDFGPLNFDSLLNNIRTKDSTLSESNYLFQIMPNNNINIKKFSNNTNFTLNNFNKIKCLDYNKFNDKLLIASDDNISIWNLTENKIESSINFNYPSRFLSIAKCANDSIYAIATTNGEVGIFNAQDYSLIDEIRLNGLVDICGTNSKAEIYFATKNKIFCKKYDLPKNIFRFSNKDFIYHILDIHTDPECKTLFVKGIKDRRDDLSDFSLISEAWDIKSKQLFSDFTIDTFGIDYELIDSTHLLKYDQNELSLLDLTSKKVIKKNKLIIEEKGGLKYFPYHNLILISNKYMVNFDNFTVYDSINYSNYISDNDDFYLEPNTKLQTYRDKKTNRSKMIIKPIDISMYNLKTHDYIKSWDCKDKISDMAINARTNTFAGINHGDIFIWDFNSNNHKAFQHFHKTYNQITVFGKYYAIHNNNKFIIIDENAEVVYELLMDYNLSDIVFCKDGKHILLLSDGDKDIVYLLELSSCEEIIERWKVNLAGRQLSTDEIEYYHNNK